jgi:L-amino acid N-acyltransferase YncA
MSNNVTFRIATREDLQKIVDTYNQSIPGRKATADLQKVTLESKFSWFDAHQKFNRPIFVVGYQGKYAGWMSFSDFYGRPAYDATAELSIYLNSEFHGMGIGKVCMIEAEKIAAQVGIKTILAFIFGHNQPSIQLFLNHGYEKWGHFPMIANMGDAERDLLVLGKKLPLSHT